MIRPIQPEDMEHVLDIWYAASVEAHHFVSSSFWASMRADMRETYIPSSETFVYEKDGVVVGFYSLYQGRLAALFVRPDQQRQGVGTTLLKDAIKRQCPLILTVYKDNTSGVRFYKNHGFVLVNQATDKLTAAVELTMRFSE